MNSLKYDEKNQFHYNEDYVFFTKSFLSQWYGAFSGQESLFNIEIFNTINVWFNCAEQAMMWSKAMLFLDYNTAERILKENHPSKQRMLGRQVKNFNQEIWDKHKFKLISSINHSKFLRNQELGNRLINETGNKKLVEAAPWDTVWGIGMGVDDPNILDETKWRGQNLLGKSLMEVRQIIANLTWGCA